MIKDTSTFSTVAIVVVLLPIAGIGATTFITTTIAQIAVQKKLLLEQIWENHYSRKVER